MRCWASFAVSVAVLIGQPYYVLASTPSAVQISAVEDAAAESARQPARYSVGDKKVARKLQDADAPAKATRKLSDVVDAPAKATRSLADAAPAPTTPSQPAARPASSAIARSLNDAPQKAAVPLAAPKAATTPPTAPQPAALQAAAPLPIAPMPIAVAQTELPQKSTLAAPKRLAPAPASPLPSALVKSEPVGTGVAAPPVRRSVSAPAESVVRATPSAASAPKSVPAPEKVAAPKAPAPFHTPAPAALLVASKPATPVAPAPVPASTATAAVQAAPKPVVAAVNAPTERRRVVQTVADSAPVVAYAAQPSAPVRRSFAVQAASQPGPMPTPAARTAVPQPEPDSDADIKSASDAPAPVAQAPAAQDKLAESYVDGDYCLDCEEGEVCEDCRYGLCDLHHDLKAMARNMPPHYPYEAQPWTYYYFRPYNYRHIEAQQQEAAAWGADPNQPYARKMFDKIYADLEKQMADQEDDAEDGK